MNGPWPAGARRWSDAEIDADVAAGRTDLRTRRLGEPLQRYLDAYDNAHPVMTTLIGRLSALMGAPSPDRALLKTLWNDETGRTAFRYLGAPPISTDDLETLAEATLNVRALDGDAHKAQKLVDVIRVIADPRRFPWLAEGREPTPDELHAARVSSTVLMASQRVQTLRRGDEKSAVEGAVKGLLLGMGWTHAAARHGKGIQKLLTDSQK